MATLFTRIIEGEIPSHRLLEDERFFAFLDIHPINPGHSLVVPKVETDKLFDLDAAVLAGILPFAQRVATALEAEIPCQRIGVIVAGLAIPHAHVHLVPIIEGEGDLSFARARPGDPAELAALAEKLRARIEAAG